ncbi:hypothetical protein [Novosphingobium sp. BW1]|uniref:hypothetical protein n=1 Tax=Novosphingobium sp. BW1 TaxID=2592621 RepID=UPI0011DEDE22|nr:hypothetical protein [Novosphingobium sp. BW1]TYC93037.1 hypothetical protein FMM79_03355 [Novosphingobium sp. BW1]
MATRGAKPKPAQLRLVDGTHRTARHGESAATKEAAQASAVSFGTLTKPTGLKGEALKAWKKFIAPAGWLDGSREPAAIAFCELWSEFRHNPIGFPASKHGQMRAYMSELGLTDERNRGDHGGKEEEDEFFGSE